MHKNKLIATALAALAVVGVTAGIAQGSSTKHATSTARASQTSAAPSPGSAPGHPGGPGARGVHSVSVVLNKAGTAFITQTTDEGTVQSVDSSAGTITILEGTKSLTYKTPTLSVPAGATVTLDGKASALSSLVAGDRVLVSTSSDGTTVMASDSSFHPEGGPGGGAPTGQMPPGQSSSSSSQ